MKDVKHIRRDIHSIAWVMPLGWDFWVLGAKKINYFGPSVRMLSPPKPLDKFQRNLDLTYSHEWGVQQHNFWPGPKGPLGRVKWPNITIIKSITKICIPNLDCLLGPPGFTC